MAKKIGEQRQMGLALVAKYGAKVISDDKSEVEVEAPRGFCWSAEPTVHSLVSAKWDNDTHEDLWKDMADRMDYGVEKCENTECEWCHGEQGEETEESETD